MDGDNVTNLECMYFVVVVDDQKRSSLVVVFAFSNRCWFKNLAFLIRLHWYPILTSPYKAAGACVF